jgi:hypothetical protein
MPSPGRTVILLFIRVIIHEVTQRCAKKMKELSCFFVRLRG